MEGQLSKWTNYVKGWQYRWFTIDPDTGVLDYYVDKEKKKQGPRGSVNLAGAVVSPSDEDSFTFSVNAVNGDIFKLRANDAKQRQHWINTLRSVAEFHARNMAQAAPPLQLQTVTPTQTSSQGPPPAQSSTSSTPSSSQQTHSTCRSYFNGSQKPFNHAPAYVTDELIKMRDMLHNIEDEQMTMIEQLEMDPQNEETIFPLDEHILVLKATSQSTLNALHHCYSILQRRVAEVQNENLQTVNLEPLDKSKTSKPTPPSEEAKRSPDMRHFRSHRSQSSARSQSKTDKASSGGDEKMSCCERALENMDTALVSQVPLDDEEEDKVVYSTGEEPDNQSVEEHKSVILHLMSQLKLGMDLTKVVLPTFILEPRSLLEMYADFFAHPDLFISIPDGVTAEDRMLAVLKFFLTSFHVGRKGALAKKPYNPILGETFSCSWDVREACSTGVERNPLNTANDVSASEDDRTVRFFAEQVSHHPPVSGFYAECPHKKICFNAHLWTKSKFYGMSIGVNNIGEAVISLIDKGEDYHFTFPNAYGRSILTFPWVELGGKVHITCAKTGYNSSVTFHTKPFYGGKLHRITGEVKNTATGKVICKVNGEWNGKIEFTYTSNQETPSAIDTKTLKIFHKRVRPVSKQESYESRKLWKTVTDSLKSRNIKACTEAKHLLEERQRREARERAESGEEWKTKIFHRHGDGWRFNNHLSLRESESSESTDAKS
ncbi:oxysterol-binding protein-related protein 11-like [Actinia tenebrosa]|uniref:Oxysterol-binding protein n=1 Tax=Actinia tenebrosa TaxID=6105 RepID=A0A6P8IDD7_ACTTE|nr:oxysterol-binding protein-related protein 11-like [Actinia tenebrosa]